MGDRRIRVLVVDDSAFMRRALVRLVNDGVGLEVVGTAANGIEAIAQVAALRPDVVTLDVEMPEMDGIATLEVLMARSPVPVVMVSTLTKRGAEVTMRCLELGAVDFMAKPDGGSPEAIANLRYLLWLKVRTAAAAHVGTTAPVRARTTTHAAPATGARATRLVAIGTSTGGPRALQELLPQLPATLSAAVLVVQHMPPQFTETMARRLNDRSALTICEAAEGMAPLDGMALVAPGGRHLGLHEDGTVRLSDAPPMWGVRPAVDVMMADVAQVARHRTLGVVLTGMGRDGAAGLGAIRAAGGQTFAQDEATCTIYGMPRAAVEAGVVDRVIPLPDMAMAILEWSIANRRRDRP
jgi:two-component system chemotaxis response regulator CheB